MRDGTTSQRTRRKRKCSGSKKGWQQPPGGHQQQRARGTVAPAQASSVGRFPGGRVPADHAGVLAAAWQSLHGMADVYSQGMLSVLDDLRRRRVFTDAEVVCSDDGSRFPVHQVLLYAACPLFREPSPGGNQLGPAGTINAAAAPGVPAAAALAPGEETGAAIATTKQGQSAAPAASAGDEARKYPVDGVRGDVMAALLEYVYTNKVSLNSDNVLSMLLAAQRFQIERIVQKCHEFLSKDISVANCVRILEFAREHKHPSLVDMAVNFISGNFIEVAKINQDFDRISYDDLKALLSSDELNLADEGKAFSAAIKWTSADASNRHRFLPSLLSAIRFGLCKVSFLQEEVFPHPMLDDVDCRAVLEPVHGLLEQLELHEGPRMINLTHPMLRPRIPRDVLFVIGGWSNGSATNLVESYDCRANRWLIFPNDRDIMPRAYHGLVALDGLIYMIGGFDGSQCFNCVRCFNPLLHRWTERACMHVARCYVSVAVLDGKIYALGGYDGDRRTNTAERYDPTTNTWSLIADMNDQRSDACATVVDSKVYIVGGFTGQQVLNTAEFYDPKVNVWTYIRAMTVPRSGVRVINYQDTVYVLGGFNGTNRLSTGEKYDLLRDRWLELPNMHTPRSNFAVAVLDDLLFAIGGFNGTTTVPFVECYDSKTNGWRRVTDMNINRSALGACVAVNLPNSREFSVPGSPANRPGCLTASCPPRFARGDKFP
ncbi:kelch-like protein 10 isoform X3 [Dermacentor albipictus]|uniref:kelch-like protein 10 isoform X3 n=1 Tax=Dermacentor albipictus TaxID=60249 RepID=UPI0031FDC226